MNYSRLLAILAIAILMAWITYLCTQEPQLSLSTEQFGLILRKDGYRSWMLHFSDGQAFDGRSVVIDETKRSFRYGYRLWPRYSHCDMHSFMRHYGLLADAPSGWTPPGSNGLIRSEQDIGPNSGPESGVFVTNRFEIYQQRNP